AGNGPANDYGDGQFRVEKCPSAACQIRSQSGKSDSYVYTVTTLSTSSYKSLGNLYNLAVCIYRDLCRDIVLQPQIFVYSLFPLTFPTPLFFFFWIRTSKCHCSISSSWISLKIELWVLTYVI